MQSTASRGAGRNTAGKRRLRRTSKMAVLLTIVALVAGACSSSDETKKSVASVPSGSGSGSATATGKGDAVAYAKCMRANGMPDFPDPEPGGNAVQIRLLSRSAWLRDGLLCGQYGSGPWRWRQGPMWRVVRGVG